jgi:FtsH-binding integral membrane protein
LTAYGVQTVHHLPPDIAGVLFFVAFCATILTFGGLLFVVTIAIVVAALAIAAGVLVRISLAAYWMYKVLMAFFRKPRIPARVSVR